MIFEAKAPKTPIKQEPKVQAEPQAPAPVAIVEEKKEVLKKPINKPINPQILKLQQLLQEKQAEPERKGPERLVSMRPKDVLFQQKQLEIKAQKAPVPALPIAPLREPLRPVPQVRKDLPRPVFVINKGDEVNKIEFRKELNDALMKKPGVAQLVK